MVYRKLGFLAAALQGKGFTGAAGFTAQVSIHAALCLLSECWRLGLASISHSKLRHCAGGGFASAGI